jgi:hypothetical protein
MHYSFNIQPIYIIYIKFRFHPNYIIISFNSHSKGGLKINNTHLVFSLISFYQLISNTNT